MSSPPSRVVRVGIIGCGEISQVAHIPTLGHMSDYFQITYLCDISVNTLNHCKNKVIGGIPKTTCNPTELCASPDVDVVLVINSTEYHAAHAILALKYNKFVFIEKPMCLSMKDADAIIAAEKESRGKVMVGYMRRYATAFIDAVKEIGGMDKILYARVRDIIGPNAGFVNQSATFPKKFTDFKKEDIDDKNLQSDKQMQQGLTVECGVPVSAESRLMWNVLGGLGSHDLSVMREALGMPSSILGASLGFPFWNVLFQYPGFVVSYESGIDEVPRFDAHIEIYSTNKSVRLEYDSPYIKGLPITMHTAENVDGVYKETMTRQTYEDAYTLEFKELYALIVEGKPIKTTAEDAKDDLEIFKMVMQAGSKAEFMTGSTGRIGKNVSNGLNGANGANGVNGKKL